MTNAYSEMREKVARAICKASGMNPDERVGFTGGTVADDFELRAEAAITTFLDALIEMDLPEEALSAADDATVWCNNGLVGLYEQEFRAILTALKPLFTKEDAQS